MRSNMRAARLSAKSINNLLILSVLLQFVILCASAIDLQRSFSFVGSAFEHKDEDYKDPIKYADDSLITRSGKSNKVSRLMRLIHNKAEQAVYHGNEHQSSTDGLKEHPIFDSHLSDDEVITNVCNEHSSRTCKYAVRAALRAGPREKAVIASALRHKPAHVDASKLLYHKLFEYSIAKTEERNLDEKLDLGINLLATKTPYGWMATKALDLASKRI